MRLPLCLLALILCIGTAFAEPVFMADFEAATDGVPDGWTFVNQRGECSGEWDDSEPLPNGHSIRLDTTADATARATWAPTQRIALQPETAYRLSFNIMLATSGGGKGAYIIAYENGVEAPANWHMGRFMNGAQDWHEESFTFKTLPDCEWIKLQCKLWESPGFAWFDDITIEEIPEDEIQRDPSTRNYYPDPDGSALQLLWYPAQRRPDRTIHLLDGFVNPVSAFFLGDKEAVADPHLILDLPEAIHLVGPVVAGRQPFAEPFQAEPEAIERDGVKLNRWRLPIQPEPLGRIKPDAPVWDRYHFVYAQPQPGCPEQFTWRWRVENAGELGPEHEMLANVVAAEEGSLGEVPDFKLFTQHSDALRLPTADERAQVLDYLHYAGVGGGLALSYYGAEYQSIDDELGDAGYFTWTWSWHGYGGASEPGQQLVYDPDARRQRTGLVCPQVQAERQEPFYSNLVKQYANALAIEREWIIINYEPPYMNVCFCERCRKAFAELTDLDEATVLAMSPKDIRALPDHAWGRFRSHQNDLIIEAHVDAAHQTDPDVKFGVCGPPRSQWHADNAMDIALFEPEVFLHAPMIYASPKATAELTRSTCEGTSELVMPFLLASDMAVTGVFPSPADLRLNMLATALSGGHGAILWVGIESLDGQLMNALRQSMGEIRELQRYIVGGTRLGDLVPEVVPGAIREIVIHGRALQIPVDNVQSPVMVWGWKSGEGHLAALINYDETMPHTVRLQAPGIEAAKSLNGPAPKPEADGVTIEMAPHEFAAFTW